MARQGSASFTIVIGGVGAVLVGAIALTFFFYPITHAIRNSAFWSAETTAGARVLTYVGGAWTFAGGIIMIALVAWIWVRTRQ